MSGKRWVWVLAAWVALTVAANAQDRDGSNTYFDCPYINYFDSGCPQAEREQARVPPPGEESEEQPERVEEQENENEWLEEAPESLLPLFPRESLAPDTPPLYHLLLMKPTLENARRYVRWYARRMNRVREVQGLVDVAGREFLAEKAGER